MEEAHEPLLLLSLSTELLIYIIACLPTARDICACQASCRKLNQIIRQSVELQYQVQKELAGVQDDRLAPEISLAERLDALIRLQKAWSNFDARQGPTHAMFFISPFPADIFMYDDYLIASRLEARFGYAATPGWAFIDLREFRLEKEMSWTTAELDWWSNEYAQSGFSLTYAVSTESDLMVVVASQDRNGEKLEIWPINFSRGGSHVAAQQATIRLHAGIPNRQVHMKIHGDRLFLWICDRFFHPNTPQAFYVVSWKQGTVCKLFSVSDRVYGWNFAFLSEDALIQIRNDEQTLEICQIVDTTDDPSGPCKLEVIGVLKLPALLDVETYCAWCYAEPIPFPHEQTTERPRRLAPRFPFRNIPEQCIVNITFALKTDREVADPGSIDCVHIVASRNQLSTLAKSLPGPIPWSVWRSSAMVVTSLVADTCTVAISGQRWIKLRSDWILNVYDFNSRRIRAAGSTDGVGLSPASEVAPEIMAPPKIDCVAETDGLGLAYSRWRRPLTPRSDVPYRDAQVDIDSERLLLVTTNQLEDGTLAAVISIYDMTVR
ncbi:hypothetical protein BC834DRAFT_531354 [Gloeopeniophorella convolvens]|nr:hypothetical protein BC834DRAFT_531354 [Gloeopeniophorella convolvens]